MEPAVLGYKSPAFRGTTKLPEAAASNQFSGILSYSIDESSGDAKMLSRSEDSFFCENRNRQRADQIWIIFLRGLTR